MYDGERHNRKVAAGGGHRRVGIYCRYRVSALAPALRNVVAVDERVVLCGAFAHSFPQAQHAIHARVCAPRVVQGLGLEGVDDAVGNGRDGVVDQHSARLRKSRVGVDEVREHLHLILPVQLLPVRQLERIVLAGRTSRALLAPWTHQLQNQGRED